MSLTAGTWFAAPHLGDAFSYDSVANECHFAQVIVVGNATITGVGYVHGATVTGTVRAALYDSSGTRVADRTTNFTPTASVYNKVPFSSTYAASPGVYFVSLVFSGVTPAYHSTCMVPSSRAAGPGSGATKTSLTVPTTPTYTVTMTTY